MGREDYLDLRALALVGRQDWTRHVLATNRLEQAWSQHCEAFHTCDLSLLFALDNCKERYSSPDCFGVLTAPGGGEEDLDTAAPVFLGDLLLLVLAAVGETLRQLLLPAQPEVLGRVDVEEDAPCLTTLLEGHL